MKTNLKEYKEIPSLNQFRNQIKSLSKEGTNVRGETFAKH
jgi:hypothetical protein